MKVQILTQLAPQPIMRNPALSLYNTMVLGEHVWWQDSQVLSLLVFTGTKVQILTQESQIPSNYTSPVANGCKDYLRGKVRSLLAFTGTKVQILTQLHTSGAARRARPVDLCTIFSTQFTCFTSKNVQILTQKELQCRKTSATCRFVHDLAFATPIETAY
jgi:hypothetical protein